MTMKNIAFHALLFGALLLAVSPAADARGVKGVPAPHRRLAKVRGPTERECEFSEKNDEVEFECESKTGDSKDSKDKSADAGSSEEAQDRIYIVLDQEIKDKIKYKVKTKNDGVSVKLEYKNEVQIEGNETETKTKFELLFLELVEYVKGSTDSDSEAYDWDTDQIVQTVPLTDWEDMSEVMNDENGMVSYFSVKTAGDEGGSTTFNFTIHRADQGEQILANSMKIDVRIIDFPWTRDDSYIALMSTLESQKKVKVEYDNEATVSKGGKSKKAKDVTISFDEDMESTFGFSTYGQYKWAEDALVESDAPFNGTVMMSRQGNNESNVLVDETTTIEVIATSPTDEDESSGSADDSSQRIAYSFVGQAAHRASDIYWDPEAGIGYESAASAHILHSTIGLVGGIIGALFFVAW